MLWRKNQVLLDRHTSYTISHISFTSLGFPTWMQRETPSHPPTAIRRVMHVKPAVPEQTCGVHRLPNEILWMIFECLSNPEYRGWCKDLLSCALVCRAWEFALKILISNFRADHKGMYRPQVFTIANALALGPDLGPSITCLCEGHFNMEEEDSINGAKNPHWAAAFLSILRAAKNLHTLSLIYPATKIPTTDCLDVLRGLENLKALETSGGTTMEPAFTYLSICPSLERLLIRDVKRRFVYLMNPLPTSPPPRLTEVMLISCYMWDEHLKYITSSGRLERLSIINVGGLSQDGLRDVLDAISESLVELRIENCLTRKNERDEYALDLVITKMKRLQSLKMTPPVATRQMLERRSRAFQNGTGVTAGAGDAHAPALPVIDLVLEVYAGDIQRRSSNSFTSLAEAVTSGLAWPGWRITPCRDGMPYPFVDCARFLKGSDGA